MVEGDWWFDIDSAVVYGTDGINIMQGFPTNTLYAPTQHFTLVFNAYVFMTMFNLFNCRRIDGGRNIFRGLHRNYYFICIWIGSMALQVL